MEEDNDEQQSDDEISLTYLTGFDVPGSVDEVRSKASASRLATLRPQLHKSHSHNLRSAAFSALKTRSSPRLVQTKEMHPVSESIITDKTIVSKLRKTTDKINMQTESGFESSSLVSKSQLKSFSQKLSKTGQSRQTKPDVKESSCARVVPLSVAFTKASTVARCIPSSTHTSNSPVSSFSTPSFSLLTSTSSSPRISSRTNTFSSFSSSLSASSVLEGNRVSLVRRQTFSSSIATSSYKSSQQLRTTAGPSKFSAQTTTRRRCGSGSFEFAKPVSSAHKASTHYQSLSGIRIKPTLGDYERPRLCLRKRDELKSGEGESSLTSNTGSEDVTESG